MKRIKLEKVTTIAGGPFKTPDSEEATLIRLLRLLIFNIPPQVIKMEDSVYAMRFYEATMKFKDKNTGVLEMEDKDHEWLMGIVEKYGPIVFNVNACKVKMALEPMKEKEDKS